MSRLQPQHAGTRGYWRWAVPAAVVFFSVNSIRVAELLPLIPRLKPFLLVMMTALPSLVLFSSPRVRAAVGRHKTVRLLAIYVCWAAIGVPFAIFPGQAAGTLVSVVYGCLSVIALLLCPKTPRVMAVLRLSFVISICVVAVSAMIQGTLNDSRLSGVGLDPNDLGSMFATGLPFALAAVVRSGARQRALAIVATIILLYALFLTASRGGIIAAVIGTTVLLLALNFRRFVQAALVGAVLLPVAIARAPEVFRKQYESLFSLEDDYNNTAYDGRIQIWKRGWGYIVDDPLLGVGLGNFPVREGEHFKQARLTGKWSTAHNSYIQAAVELGVPGLLVFVLLLVQAFKAALILGRRPFQSPEYLAGLCAFGTAAIFLSHAYHWFFFGVIALFAHAASTVEVASGIPTIASQSRGQRLVRRRTVQHIPSV